MKAAIALAVLLSSAAVLSTPSSVRIQHTSIGGYDYVRLDDWARANSFQMKWLSKNDVQVSNQKATLRFTKDSHAMVLNGVAVSLSNPVAVKNDSAFIGNIDVISTIQPILWPPRNRARTPVKHICLDPGHGGRQPGNQEGREQEKKYTLLFANELGAQLRQAGYTVSYTRTSDAFVDLPDRPEIARRRGADLFVSLHFNSALRTSSEIGGIEVYCLSPQRTSSTNARGEGANTGAVRGNLNNSKNVLLAYQLQKSLVRSTGLDDRGVKRARFAVLRTAEMPAVLIEAGFMSNPREAKKIYDPAWRRQTAKAIVEGIQNYRQIVEL